MDTAPFPGFSAAQIRYLESVFPNRCARGGMSLEAIWMEAGARNVIDHIKSRMLGSSPQAAHDLDLEAEALAPVRAAKRRR